MSIQGPGAPQEPHLPFFHSKAEDPPPPVISCYYQASNALNPPPIPYGVNSVILDFDYTALDAQKGVSGLTGPFTKPRVLQNFIDECHRQSPPIKVMIKIGGTGGKFENTWSQLNSANIDRYSSSLQKFCNNNGLDGIEFNWNTSPSPEGQTSLIGSLIKDFKCNIKGTSPLQATLSCSYGQVGGGLVSCDIDALFKAATNADGSNAIDHVTMLGDEDTTMQSDIPAWETFIGSHGLSPSQLTVGMGSTTDIKGAATWNKSQGTGTCISNWDPQNVTDSNNETKQVWSIYNQPLNKPQRPTE